MRVSRDGIWLFCVCTAVIAAIGAVSVPLCRDYLIEDPFIIYTYARNIAAGRGYVFNASERVLGTTCPLYTLLLAFCGQFSHEIPSLAFVISGASLVATAVLLMGILWSLGLRLAGFFAAVFFVMMSYPYACLGLETMFFGVLISGSILCAALGRHPPAVALASLACLTRPDAVILLGCLLVLGSFREGIRFVLRGIALAAALILPWGLFSAAYFGTVIPQPFHSKVEMGMHPARWISTFLDPIVCEGLFGGGLNSPRCWIGIAIVLAGALFLCVRKPDFGLFAVGYALLHLTAYSILGTKQFFFWYYLPALLVTILALSAGIEAAMVLPLRRISGSVRSSAVSACVAVALVCPLLQNEARRFSEFRASIYTSPYIKARHDAYRMIALWMKKNVPPGAQVAVLEPGTIGYYGEMPLFDLDGLVSKKDPRLTYDKMLPALKTPYFLNIETDAPRGKAAAVWNGVYTRVIEFDVGGFFPTALYRYSGT